MSEQWKPVLGHDAYEVSDRGNVRSYKAYGAGDLRNRLPRLMKPRCSHGYMRVPLRVAGKKRWRMVHDLVLEAFVGPCAPDMQCCHHNGDRSDNRLENLRWDTRFANAADRDRHGRTARGETHGCAKLTAHEAVQIRAHQGFLSQRHLADVFGVSRRTVTFIHQRRTWRSAA